MIRDLHGRTVNYMRISVTDRCNLRCFYCRSGQNLSYIPHSDILRYEEIGALLSLVRDLDVRKVRLTGGEPFIRKAFMDFLHKTGSEFPELDIRITTNGTLLDGKAQRLKDAGVSHINISLDTLDRDKYQRITGRDYYTRVRKAIDQCLETGLSVKINAVAMRGVNDEELAQFILLAATSHLDMRFIEFMPMGGGTSWNKDMFWPVDEILAQARELADLRALERRQGDTGGPAKMYSIAGGPGRLGFISPLSNHFCGSCNRLRITSEGALRTCLFSDKEYRLRPLLRHPKLGLRFVRRVMERAGRGKPLGHDILMARAKEAVCGRVMSAIGG